MDFAIFKAVFMCTGVLGRICVSAPCVCSTHRSQKKALDALELELQKAVSFHIGAGNRTWVLHKSNPQNRLIIICYMIAVPALVET